MPMTGADHHVLVVKACNGVGVKRMSQLAGGVMHGSVGDWK